MTAHIINRLLRRQCPTSSPTEHLPTPTPAAWEGVMRSLDFAYSSITFYGCIRPICTVTPAERALKSLQDQLPWILFNLLAGHLPNLDLDVTEVMR